MAPPLELSEALLERYQAALKAKNKIQEVVFPWVREFQCLIRRFEEETGLTFSSVRVDHFVTPGEPTITVVNSIQVMEEN